MLPILVAQQRSEEEQKVNDQAIELAKKAVRCMIICTCIAYERFDFQTITDELENMATPLGSKFIKRVMPIIQRREDTIEAFTRDMMLAARDVVQEYFTDDITESEE